MFLAKLTISIQTSEIVMFKISYQYVNNTNCFRCDYKFLN